MGGGHKPAKTECGGIAPTFVFRFGGIEALGYTVCDGDGDDDADGDDVL